MKGRTIPYSAEELAWIESHARENRRETHARFCDTFSRSDVSLSNFNALCKRKGWLTGRTGRFERGQASWNKGRSMPANPNSARTQFKKGAAPANRVPLWTERVGKDGYIEMKVPRPNPYVSGCKTRFMHKHRYLWEEANGPLPDGHALKCVDGDRTNCEPSNWIAIPRALLPRLNGRFGRDYDNAPEEIKPTILAVAKLEHAAREVKK